MTGVRDDGDCDDYDDSSLEFLYSRTLDKSAILFALFEYLSEIFFILLLSEGSLNLTVYRGTIIGESWSFSRRLIN